MLGKAGTVPHVDTLQHPGLGNGQLSALPSAEHSAPRSHRFAGIVPVSLLWEACRNVRFFRVLKDASEPVKFCVSNHTFLRWVRGEKSINGPDK